MPSWRSCSGLERYGEGVWPPDERFGYAEDVTFEFVGDPFLLYAQRSWSLDDGSPIHFRRRFLSPAGPGIVELQLAHPIGITEVAVGTVDDGVIELSSTAVSLAPPPAPSPSSAAARGRGDELSFELQMATEGVELQWHVGSKLARA